MGNNRISMNPMTKPAAFKASYADWKLVKTRSCVQIIFEIPVEKANEAYEILGGMPISATESWFAIARLKQQQEETNNIATEKPAPTQPPARAPKNRLTTRAAILCNDQMFHRYLRQQGWDINNGADAAEHIRTFCKVASRKDILPGTQAATRLDLLESAFTVWRDADKFVEA
jgi:hypothetical protein